jgi:hypothetical protein
MPAPERQVMCTENLFPLCPSLLYLPLHPADVPRLLRSYFRQSALSNQLWLQLLALHIFSVDGPATCPKQTRWYMRTHP